jgi:hypothetical protein
MTIIAMLFSRVSALALFILIFLGWETMAMAAAGSEADPPGARLVFTHVETGQQLLRIRDQRSELTALRMAFKNEGEAAARLLTLATTPVLTDHILTAAEEEDYFSTVAKQWSIKLSGEVQPGQSIFFASQEGIDDASWAEFQAKRKYLYSFLTVSYANPDGADQIVTETCVWFENADIAKWNACQSGHNRIFQREK